MKANTMFCHMADVLVFPGKKINKRKSFVQISICALSDCGKSFFFVPTIFFCLLLIKDVVILLFID